MGSAPFVVAANIICGKGLVQTLSWANVFTNRKMGEVYFLKIKVKGLRLKDTGLIAGSASIFFRLSPCPVIKSSREL